LKAKKKAARKREDGAFAFSKRELEKRMKIYRLFVKMEEKTDKRKRKK